MDNIKQFIYKEYNIYYISDLYSEIAKKIIDKKFKEIKKIKDTKRNYVSLIEVDGIKYIYKEPRNEYRIPQRQILTFLKRGEALCTLINVNEMIRKFKFYEYVKPYLAIIKRKRGVIVFSAILFEYIDNGRSKNFDDLNKIILKMQEIHQIKRYHGDFNPSNFIINGNEIKILDTQAKKMRLTKYRAHYDMLTMQEDYPDMIYPYKKSCIYYFAYMIKKFKRLKWISWLKIKKKELRDKGWKI